jgi:transposase, IS5 family
MIKMYVLAGGHRLSHYEVELLATDRLSFRHFPGYPEKIPDRLMLWAFKKSLTDKGKIHLMWDELQRHLDEQVYSIKQGTIQVATFITSDPGHAPADKSRAKTR